MQGKGEQIAEQAKRDYLDERLALCTEKQKEFFWKIVKGKNEWLKRNDKNYIYAEDLSNLIDLVERTIEKNEKEPHEATH